MLSKFDDFAIHQTPEPIAQPASSDRNVYDRYWFNGYDRDGEFYFGVALGYYPNRGIMDAGFSIVRDGEQHAFHASRRAPKEPSETTVGPFRIEVVEPMRSLRVILEDNETGISCDLEFIARTACIEEGRQTLRREGRIFMDATRFAQMGYWRGHVSYDGKRVEVDPARVYGTKDRSWGQRPIGEPESGGAPSTSLPSFFFLWSPTHWEDHCTHYGVFEDPDGHKWHQDAAIVPTYESPDAIPGVTDDDTVVAAETWHDLSYHPGTRLIKAATLGIKMRDGSERVIELEPLLCFRMKGIGYTHQEWGHGLWKGENVLAGESWKIADLDPMDFTNLHVQQVVRARSEGREGTGVLEQICIGPHAPSGFTDFLDPAK